MTSLHIEPLTLTQANKLVTDLHRHHKKVQGHRFSIGVFDEDGTCHGAAIVGRPVNRVYDQYHVAEVTRLVTDGTYNACSMLYSACARAAKAMGFWWIQTYILDSEPGTSLKASGWKFDGMTEGRYHRNWHGIPPETPADYEIASATKQRWVLELTPRTTIASVAA